MSNDNPFPSLKWAHKGTYGDDVPGSRVHFPSPDQVTCEIMKDVDELEPMIKRLLDSPNLGTQDSLVLGLDTESYPESFDVRYKGQYNWIWKQLKMDRLGTWDDDVSVVMNQRRIRNTRKPPSKQPPALLQIATETRCIIVPLIVFADVGEQKPKLPTVLTDLLENDKARFVGVGVGQDIQLLADWFDFTPKRNWVELNNFEAIREMLVENDMTPSLANMAKVCGRVPCKISDHVHHSIYNWLWPTLPKFQLMYAMRDAVAPRQDTSI